MNSIGELRKIMGTNPKENVELKTEFYEGVKGISVKLMDYNINPYKAMYNMATSTWGNTIDKWHKTSLEGKFQVIKAILEFKALPNAMEEPTFCFAIEKCSRSAFDQIARARIGAVFSSQGWRDNDHSDIGFRVPQSIWDDAQSLDNFKISCNMAKKEYHRLISEGQSNWQDARALLPISACHNFSMSMNYMALRNFCNKRLKNCEQADTVAVAWLIREEVHKVFPLLGSYLRPSCDWKRICEYHQNYALSEAFGCLFRSCGRNKDLNQDNYASFNYSCSNKDTIAKQLGITIPNADEYLPISNVEYLSKNDFGLFNAD